MSHLSPSSLFSSTKVRSSRQAEEGKASWPPRYQTRRLRSSLALTARTDATAAPVTKRDVVVALGGLVDGLRARLHELIARDNAAEAEELVREKGTSELPIIRVDAMLPEALELAPAYPLG